MNVTFDEALRLILGRCRPVTSVEWVKLGNADQRIVAEDVVAAISVPPADNSAVDGYAFRHADLESGPLSLVGVAAAGRPFTGAVEAGQAVRIFTGALPPSGCDTIAMQEDVIAAANSVSVPAGVRLNANIRKAGEDTAAGAILLKTGCVLGPPEIGVLASVGLSSVVVHTPPRVAVFSSGDELVQPGGAFTRGGSL